MNITITQKTTLGELLQYQRQINATVATLQNLGMGTTGSPASGRSSGSSQRRGRVGGRGASAVAHDSTSGQTGGGNIGNVAAIGQTGGGQTGGGKSRGRGGSRRQAAGGAANAQPISSNDSAPRKRRRYSAAAKANMSLAQNIRQAKLRGDLETVARLEAQRQPTT